MYDPVALMTKRLIVKEADSTDLDTLLNLWGDFEIMQQAFHQSGAPKSPGGIQEWWRKYQMRRTEAPWERQFVIQIKDGPFIGESGWSRIDDPEEFPDYNIEPRLTTVLADVNIDLAYRGLGYGSEALKELLWWAFEEAGIDIIIAPPHKGSKTAKEMYLNCGFRDTGGIVRSDFHVFELKSGNDAP
jgi:RimJ/RimL family protein N-acetyltransferase